MSKARKQKMLEMDKVRGTKMPLSEIEMEQSRQAEALLNKA